MATDAGQSAAGPPDYRRFLEAKLPAAPTYGAAVPEASVNPILKPHQRAIVRWMVEGGRRACFAAFGLGKSVIQLEAVRLTLARAGGRGLIVIPLGVRQEFFRDAAMLGTVVRFIRRIEETDETGIYLANYETVRDGKLDPRAFTVASLDEASVLRGFGGTKTFREFMRLFAGQAGPRAKIVGGVPYRFVATATPSPNEYVELLAYAAYLDVMDVSAAKTRFFKRDSTKADHLTLHPHKEREFWLWVASWAIFVQRPSDLGFSDEGYDLPPLDVRWHEVATDHSRAGADRDGQARMWKNAALGVTDAAREKRDSMAARISKLMELREVDLAAHRIIWHDLEDERRALEKAIPDLVAVYGSQGLDERERTILGFADGRIREIGGKPSMLGSGVNWQRHCAWAIFLGIGFKAQEVIQAIHRVYRFLQTKPVRVDLIYTEAEREVRRVLEEKWRQHEVMVAKMAALIREHGLAHASYAQALTRTMDVQRAEVVGDGYRLINGDAVEETRQVETGSVHLIVTSIPFSTQYEYSPSYRDLGHTDSDEHFFAHLGYLTPELLRVLQPGRVAAVHVKDRIVPGGLTGLGFQTVSPFSDYTVAHFKNHGFAFLGRKTVVTDVVRENNQTYRLGWTEQCKDGSRMGAGLPEYVLLFRKPPSDTSDGYADVPVVKAKAEYSRTRWQIDAHGFMRSNGNRHLRPEEIEDLPHDVIFKLFRKYSLTTVYDFEHHVRLGEALEQRGRLPVTFMLLQPASWHPDVWTDIARMRTLNMVQAQKGQEQHLCPLPFDIVNRLIVQFSPSTAARGVEQWIASLRASRASRGPWPESDAASRTSGGSGPTSRAWFVRWDPSSSSWRTSQASLLADSDTFLETWPRSGSMRSGTCFQPRIRPRGGEQRPGRQRVLDLRAVLGHAEPVDAGWLHEGRGEARGAVVGRASARAPGERATASGGLVADPQHAGQRGLGAGHDHHFPPGPADHEGWRAVLSERPDLAPALSVGHAAGSGRERGPSGERRERGAGREQHAQPEPAGDGSTAEVEPLVRGLADGLAPRVERLRAAGNGVVPVVAGYALIRLADRAPAWVRELLWQA